MALVFFVSACFACMYFGSEMVCFNTPFRIIIVEKHVIRCEYKQIYSRKKTHTHTQREILNARRILRRISFGFSKSSSLSVGCPFKSQMHYATKAKRIKSTNDYHNREKTYSE